MKNKYLIILKRLLKKYVNSLNIETLFLEIVTFHLKKLCREVTKSLSRIQSIRKKNY